MTEQELPVEVVATVEETVNPDEFKEISELIAAIQPIGVAGVKIAADGKVNFGDFKHVGELLGSFSKIKDGVVGLKGLKLRDLEKEELMKLGTLSFDMIKSLIAAYSEEVK